MSLDFIRGKEPSFPQCEQLKKANKGRINCDYLKEKENLENECSNLLNPKKEKSLDIFSQRIDKILDCVLKYCADKSRIQPGLFGKFNRQFTKLLKSVFGSEDIKWWSGEDNAENIVIVTNNEVIGDIHEKNTGQWIDVEPVNSSRTKCIEFETNQPSTSGPSYKSFRIIQESDIKHLGPIRESIVNNLTNRIIW
uniref:Uncharacterized protein n=1 Tax=Meloidogyne hapla TaxID=6305 RepID=A0A1I8B6Q0_MELHA